MKLRIAFIASLLILSVSVMTQNHYSKAEIEASRTIRLNNRIVELQQRHKSATKLFEDMIASAQFNIENTSNNIREIDYKSFETQLGNLSQFKSAYNEAPDFSKKKEIREIVNNAYKNTQESIKGAKTISQYFSKGEFRSDNNQIKYNSIIENLSSDFNKAKLGYKKAAELIEPEADKAEIISLRRSKIAEFIIPMKNDYNDLKYIIKQLNAEDINSSEINKAIATLSKYLDEDEDISKKDTTKFKIAESKDLYLDFYKQSKTTLSSISKYIMEQDRNPSAENLDALFADINTYYNATIKAYNSFINELR